MKPARPPNHWNDEVDGDKPLDVEPEPDDEKRGHGDGGDAPPSLATATLQGATATAQQAVKALQRGPLPVQVKVESLGRLPVGITGRRLSPVSPADD